MGGVKDKQHPQGPLKLPPQPHSASVRWRVWAPGHREVENPEAGVRLSPKPSQLWAGCEASFPFPKARVDIPAPPPLRPPPLSAPGGLWSPKPRFCPDPLRPSPLLEPLAPAPARRAPTCPARPEHSSSSSSGGTVSGHMTRPRPGVPSPRPP